MSNFYERALAANGDYGTLALDKALTDELHSILRRDADVRALDDWAHADTMRFWDCGRTAAGDEWHCALFRAAEDMEECLFAATPDEARAKAAAWVREQVKP